MAENKPQPDTWNEEHHSPGNPPLEGDVPAAEEASLLNFRTLLLAAGGLITVIVLVHLLSAGLFFYFSRERQPLAARPPDQEHPAPSLAAPPLQVNPPEDLQVLLATQQANLSGYGWVDREGGRVRIPIDRAMEKIAQGGGLPAPGETVTPASSGEARFQSLGCAACHTAENTDLAPTLVGLFGEPVQLEGGETPTADEAYLRESILNPQAKIVAGYQPVMPSFADQVTEEDLEALVAYIQSLGDQ
jgi:mono/diheme cytochrome c family protein